MARAPVLLSELSGEVLEHTYLWRESEFDDLWSSLLPQAFKNSRKPSEKSKTPGQEQYTRVLILILPLIAMVSLLPLWILDFPICPMMVLDSRILPGWQSKILWFSRRQGPGRAGAWSNHGISRVLLPPLSFSNHTLFAVWLQVPVLSPAQVPPEEWRAGPANITTVWSMGINVLSFPWGMCLWRDKHGEGNACLC